MVLTEEQKQRIAANRAEAIRRQQMVRAANFANAQQSRPSIPAMAAPRPSIPAPRPAFATSTSAPRPLFSFPRPAVSNTRPSTSSFRPQSNPFNTGQPRPNRFGNPRPGHSSFRPPAPGSYASNALPRSTFPVFPSKKPKSFRTVSLSVFNSERFMLEIKPVMQPVVEFAKSVQDRQYDSTKKCWHFPWKRYDEVKRGLKAIKDSEFDIEELLPCVVEFFRNKKPPEQPDENNLANLKVTMWSTLYDYQKEGILRGIANNGRILIADEMGLGKSIQALGLAFYYRTEWPLLIVTPSSVKGSWDQQIEKFLPNMCEVTLIEKTSDIIPTARSTRTVVIISHSMMMIKKDALLKTGFYVVIFDESHMLKEEKAKRTKAAMSLARAANRVILLSGTPAISRPAELYTQIQMINPKLFPKFHEFAVTYCDGRDTKFGFVAKGAARTDELTAILKESILIRRTKENIVLPAKRREFIYLSEKNINIQMKELQDAKEQATKLTSNRKVKKKELHESMMQYYSATALVKCSAVSSYLKNEYFKTNDFKRKMLIFAHHSVVLDAIASMLVASDVCHIRIDGSTKERTSLVEEFQTNEKCKVAVLSMTAAGVGITLTAASLVIFAELHWTPSTLMQAEDRAHRVGQLHPVDVHYLIARNTVDEDMLNLIKQKMKILTSVSLNTGSMDNAKKTYEEPGVSKITSFFKIMNNEKENIDDGGNEKKGNAFDDDEVIILDDEDDWNNDEIFIEEDSSSEAKKRPSSGDTDEVPPKRSK
uniref:SWI/SNF-related matrix-associated actin-dependent regulator of chromatin subfamily A-like protein 1 n=1 Tax=Panagrolaimus sp. PS1159 TaxID=55785 RepID=A0AC35F623_9BILA